jgi:hypothetical protein
MLPGVPIQVGHGDVALADHMKTFYHGFDRGRMSPARGTRRRTPRVCIPLSLLGTERGLPAQLPFGAGRHDSGATGSMTKVTHLITGLNTGEADPVLLKLIDHSRRAGVSNTMRDRSARPSPHQGESAEVRISALA